MRIYALVGSSGTGKSYKALEVTYEKNIDYIIDDGLLINKGKILAGISAKQCKTIMEAVKTAIFFREDHKNDIVKKIKEEKVNSILILGTSEKMIKKIMARLELEDNYELIKIDEISTVEEMQKAKLSREKGNHIIPVPTVQVKKMATGLSINPIRRFFRKTNQEKVILEKTIIRPAFSYIGKFYIDPNVIKQLTQFSLSKFDSISKVNKMKVVYFGNEVEIYINLNIKEVNILKESEYIQKYIKNAIEGTTCINVNSINLYINKMIYTKD